jgi:hypothetical protein
MKTHTLMAAIALTITPAHAEPLGDCIASEGVVLVSVSPNSYCETAMSLLMPLLANDKGFWRGKTDWEVCEILAKGTNNSPVAQARGAYAYCIEKPAIPKS